MKLYTNADLRCELLWPKGYIKLRNCLLMGNEEMTPVIADHRHQAIIAR